MLTKERKMRPDAKIFLHELSNEIMKRDYPVHAFVMNAKTYTQMFGLKLKKQEIGKVNEIWGIDVIVKKSVSNDVVYAFSEPRYTGIELGVADTQDLKRKKDLISYDDIKPFVNLKTIVKGTFSKMK